MPTKALYESRPRSGRTAPALAAACIGAIKIRHRPLTLRADAAQGSECDRLALVPDTWHSNVSVTDQNNPSQDSSHGQLRCVR